MALYMISVLRGILKELTKASKIDGLHEMQTNLKGPKDHRVLVGHAPMHYITPNSYFCSVPSSLHPHEDFFSQCPTLPSHHPCIHSFINSCAGAETTDACVALLLVIEVAFFLYEDTVVRVGKDGLHRPKFLES